MRQEEENREKKKEEMTYAKVAQKTIERVNQNTENEQTVLDSIGLRSIIMIMVAHIHNIIEPGIYNERLN